MAGPAWRWALGAELVELLGLLGGENRAQLIIGLLPLGSHLGKRLAHRRFDR